MSTINKRFQFGDRGYAPAGKPVPLGAARDADLGKIEEYGTARSISLFVGQNRGLAEKNQRGSCAIAPTHYDAHDIDRAFFEMRAAQVGRANVGGTRQENRGWFQGDPEASLNYEVAFIPTDDEPDFKTFEKNLNRLAEGLAKKFCQDSVLIVRDDGTKRDVASAEWDVDDD
jgi:hypothetical protein